MGIHWQTDRRETRQRQTDSDREKWST